MNEFPDPKFYFNSILKNYKSPRKQGLICWNEDFSPQLLPCRCNLCHKCLSTGIVDHLGDFHYQPIGSLPCFNPECRRDLNITTVLLYLSQESQEQICNLLLSSYLQRDPDISKCSFDKLSLQGMPKRGS